MTQESMPPFIKWGDYKSKDPTNPDILEIRALEPELFTTEYSENARIELKVAQVWEDRILPLKSHSSNNASLLRKWIDLVKQGQISKGVLLTIKTHLGTTKITKRPIRRFAIALR